MASVGIIGTGPAGLTSALALERYGPPHLRITLFDRNADARDYPGVEYGIQERAVRALERLGHRAAALDGGHPAECMTFHLMRTGANQLSVPVNPEYTVDVSRQEFLEKLTNLVQAPIKRRHNVASVQRLNGGQVALDFDTRDASPAPSSVEFDLVVACDGIHSAVRREYFPSAQDFDRGFQCIYLLVEATQGDARIPASFWHKSAGGTVQFTMGRYATTILFPQGRGRLVFALGFDHATRAQIWRDHGLADSVNWADVPADTKKAIALTLAAATPFDDNFMAQSLELVPDWNSPRVYLWAMRDTDPLDSPFAPDANVILVGDACHAFLPTIGMGASLAIEDAERLGARLGAYLTGLGSQPVETTALQQHVFEPYSAERRGTWHDLMGRARSAAENFIGQEEKRRFDIAPYVPTRIGSAAVAAGEWIAQRLGI